jgi:hypothetical protein
MQPCGECSLCCKLLETHGVKSEVGEMCCFHRKGVGCSIHEARPKECREYQCMWSQMPGGISTDLRPDKLHIIFEKISDRTIFGLQDPNYAPTELAKRQAFDFVRQGYSVVISHGNKNTVLNERGNRESAIQDVNDHIRKVREKLKNDCAELH